MSQTHDELRELLGVYALDAVEGDERAAIERHLATCPRCRAEVEEHREVAALLADPGADAPPGLWDRIAGSLDEAPPPLVLTPLAPRAVRRRRWLPPAAIGIAAALLIAVLGAQVRQQDDLINRLEASAADPLLASYERALGDPDSTVVELAGVRGVQAVVLPDGTGYLGAAALPRLDPNRTYQLWGKVGDDLVSLGVLGADPDVVPFRADGVTLLAVTEETAGGVVRSSQDAVVSGPLA
jgi:anti-sigma factor RsiW